MRLDDLVSGTARDILFNEYKRGKNSATYLFYAGSEEYCLKVALSYVRLMICNSEVGGCEDCDNCKSLGSLSYPDLVILEPEDGVIKVEHVRNMLNSAAQTSYYGGKKIYIIKGINTMRKEAANLILKSIEEPNDNVIFILISNTLNVLPTILSRAMIIELTSDLSKLKEKFNIDDRLVELFDGNLNDILEYVEYYKKNGIKELDSIYKYTELPLFVSNFYLKNNFENRFRLISSIEDLLDNIDDIDKLDRVMLSEKIEKNVKNDRMFAAIILSIILSKYVKIKKDTISLDNLERLVSIKDGLRFNTNLGLSLMNFFLLL